MRLLSFHSADGLRLGIWTDAGIVDVRETARGAGQRAPDSVKDVAAGGAQALEQLRQVLGSAGVPIPESEVVYGPALPDPGKIICVGANYRKHAEESGIPIPAHPIYFAKFANSLAGHRTDVAAPAVTAKVDYEVELVAVIGRPAHRVPVADALDHVFGYATGNDLSARDLQMRGPQWTYGKAIDGFAPLGPFVVTADEVPDPQALDLKCWVNSELRQDSNTADMIFSVAELVSDLSQVMTLEPGDVVFTGTPQGVAMGMDPPSWVQQGDEIACEVERLGRLVTYLVADKDTD